VEEMRNVSQMLWTHVANTKKQTQWELKRRLLMMGYIGLNIRSKKGIKMKMKTTISSYGKGIEIVFQCTFHI
jgi:hypothetical protein